MSSPAEIFRGLDAATGDWQFGQGIASYAQANNAILLDVQTALRTFVGDAFWNATFGVDWINLLGGRDTQNAILAQTRQVIAQCQGITGISTVTFNLNRQTRTLVFQYTISTVYSANVAGSSQITI